MNYEYLLFDFVRLGALFVLGSIVFYLLRANFPFGKFGILLTVVLCILIGSAATARFSGQMQAEETSKISSDANLEIERTGALKTQLLDLTLMIGGVYLLFILVAVQKNKTRHA